MSQQPVKLSDDVIIRLIVKEGRTELQSLIYKRYFDKVSYRCYTIIKDREMAKDLAHDVLLKVFANLSRFEGRSSFGLWVRTIAYNYSIDYVRKQKRMYFEEYEETKLENTYLEDTTINEKLQLEERSLQLKNLIGELKVKDQNVIKMRYYEGLSIKEISEATGVGISAIKMRIKRAKTRLMEKAAAKNLASQHHSINTFAVV